jgi:hypothetical protein
MYWHWVKRTLIEGRTTVRPFFYIQQQDGMPMSYSKSRERAETAFNDVQSQFFARSSASQEIDHVAQARDAKTLRLREARLAHEKQLLTNMRLAREATNHGSRP